MLEIRRLVSRPESCSLSKSTGHITPPPRLATLHHASTDQIKSSQDVSSSGPNREIFFSLMFPFFPSSCVLCCKQRKHDTLLFCLFFQSVAKAGTGSRGKGTPRLEGGRVIAKVSITEDVCLHRSLHRHRTEKRSSFARMLRKSWGSRNSGRLTSTLKYSSAMTQLLSAHRCS